MTTETKTEPTRWGLKERRQWHNAACRASGSKSTGVARVAGFIALAVNNDGWVRHSASTLASELGMTDRAAREARSWLTEKGFLRADGPNDQRRKWWLESPADTPERVRTSEPLFRGPHETDPGTDTYIPRNVCVVTAERVRSDPGTTVPPKYCEGPEGVLHEVTEDSEDDSKSAPDGDDPDAVDENGYLLDPEHRHSSHQADFCAGCRELATSFNPFHDEIDF